MKPPLCLDSKYRRGTIKSQMTLLDNHSNLALSGQFQGFVLQPSLDERLPLGSEEIGNPVNDTRACGPGSPHHAVGGRRADSLQCAMAKPPLLQKLMENPGRSCLENSALAFR